MVQNYAMERGKQANITNITVTVFFVFLICFCSVRRDQIVYFLDIQYYAVYTVHWAIRIHRWNFNVKWGCSYNPNNLTI